MAARVKTSRTAPERGRNSGMSVVKARASILRAVDGSVSPTVINFKI